MVEAERVLAAARDGDIRTLQTLRRSVPFVADSYGSSALHHASRFGKLDCVKWMVQRAGIKPNSKSKTGATALHDAATQGKLLCVKFFIQECNVDPDLSDNSGHTALHLASRFGHYEVVKWLLEKAKCNPRAKTLNRMSAVHFAASGGNLKCLELLVNKASYGLINETATDGTTPLYLAAQDGSLACMKYLHSVGAKCDKSRDGMHLIHAAAQNGHLDCVGYLVIHGHASIVEEDSTGAFPAHYAAGQGHLPVLKWLHVRSDLNMKDKLGGTPLHDAAEKGQLHCIQYLVEVAELEVKAKDNGNMSPIDLAEKYNHKASAEYMRSSATKILKLKAQRMSNYSQAFDTVTADSSAGASFLHVLKKKPSSANLNRRSPSPSSAKGPDVPPLLCSPEQSPGTVRRRPPLITFAKSSEWDQEDMETKSDSTPSDDAADVSHTYATKAREDRDKTALKSILKDPAKGSSRRGSTHDERTAEPDAYSKNGTDAKLFETSKISDDVLDAAKRRTLFLKKSTATFHNGYSSATPSPDVDFDESVTERSMKNAMEFSRKVDAARQKTISPSSLKSERSASPRKVEGATPRSEKATPRSEEATPSIEEATPRIEEAAPRIEKVTPRSEKAAPSVFSPVQPDESTVKSTTQGLDQKASRTSDSPASLPNGNIASSPETTEDSNETINHEDRETLHSRPQPQSEPEQEEEPPTANSVSKDLNEGVKNDDPVVRVQMPTLQQTLVDPEPSTSRDPGSNTNSSDIQKLRAQLPLRDRQLIPMAHFGDATTDDVAVEFDEETWRTLPEWKRQIFRNRIMKQQQKVADQRMKEDVDHDKFAGHPKWKVPILERQESDRLKEEQKYAGMPEWKKNLLQRRQYMYK